MQELKPDGARVSNTAHETCWRPLETDEQTTGHGTLQPEEVIEKSPDILFCEKVKKPFHTDNSLHLGNEKPPAPKKLKKSTKKTIKLNTDCNIDESTIMPPNL